MKEEMIHLYINLLRDSFQVVVRAATISLAEFIPVIEPTIVRTKIVPALQSLCTDTRESIQIWIMRAISACAAILSIDDTFKYLCPLINQLVDKDRSWRVKFSVADGLESLVAQKHLESIADSFIEPFTILLRVCLSSPLIPFSHQIQLF